MSDLTPITREEALLDGADLEPITRKEQFIKRIYDKTQEVPTPITREEWFLNKAGEGGSEVTVEQLNATENGTYSEQGKAYSPVIVEVPEPTLISKSITANGTYSASADNADGYSSVTVAVDGFKKKSIANTPTDIASFNDGTANPMPSLKISIEPQQDLHGYDYPWAGGAGKNLAYLEQGSLDLTNGAETPSTTRVRTNFIPVEQLTTYIASSQNNGWSVRNGIGYDENKDYVKYGIFPSVANNMMSVDDVNVKYVRFIYSHADGAEECSPSDYWYQLEKGSTATTFAPYSNICPISGNTEANVTVADDLTTPTETHTTSIPFHDSSDNPITVYGSTLNVTSGELRATHVSINLEDYASSIFFNAGYNCWVLPITPLALFKGNYDIPDILTSVGYIPRTFYYSAKGDNAIGVTSVGYLFIGNNSSTVKPTGQVVYPLATPQTYQLTPTQVSTLLGQNNIFADCGQILQGEYFVTL